MICNDLPALQFSVQTNGAGICIDMADKSQIDSALRKIDDRYEEFSEAAYRLYDSISMEDIVCRIIARATHHSPRIY